MSQDDFEAWLFEMDEQLEAFLSENVSGVADELDYSTGSLDILEEWMLSKYPSADALLQGAQKVVLDRLARYIGETIRKKYGLKWKIELKNPDNVCFGLPVMTDEKGKRNYECPHSLTTATVERQEPGYLRMVFDNVML